ncbi:MAG: hypothetical protein WBA93_02575 [Microcoleaceae cyanobacterium]
MIVFKICSVLVVVLIDNFVWSLAVGVLVVWLLSLGVIVVSILLFIGVGWRLLLGVAEPGLDGFAGCESGVKLFRMGLFIGVLFIGMLLLGMTEKFAYIV